jgi:ABC-2 type transport system ATP-binding protein
VLELQGLTRRYGELVALDDLSFTVAEGQMFGFVGSNGAGKTTAMRIVLGVLAPDAGEVRWRGRPMTDEIRKRLGYLPEDHGQTFSIQCACVPLVREQATSAARADAPLCDVLALDEVSFMVGEAQLFGFIGPMAPARPGCDWPANGRYVACSRPPHLHRP